MARLEAEETSEAATRLSDTLSSNRSLGEAVRSRVEELDSAAARLRDDAEDLPVGLRLHREPSDST